MVFNGDEKSRIPIEIVLFRNVIDRWKEVINIFKNKNINKVTFGCSKERNNWGWYNFYWVRGSYLKKCEKPIITDNRFYYEEYLGTQCNKNNIDECYSLSTNNTQLHNNDEIVSIISDYLTK